MESRADDPALADWAAQQPTEVTGDPLWKLDAYRHAAYAAALARDDAERIAQDSLRTEVAAQLLRSATSVAANVAEGYGRPTTADRIRFISYAIGSVREAFTWYDACGRAMPDDLLRERLARLARLRRILLGLVGRLRQNTPRRIERW